MSNTFLSNRLGTRLPDFFADWSGPWGLDVSATALRQAPYSIWEADDALHLELELPGVREEDVQLTVHEGRLTVAWNRHQPSEDRNYRVDGFRYGEQERLFRLSDDLDTESIVAELRDGVLHVTLKKVPERQPRRIEVQSG